MILDLIDVFGASSLRGNPLAVVHGASSLDTTDMLSLTQWLGFSETTFLLPPTDPGADYSVRIFYPGGELPFAGHPTLGTCHAWLQAGGRPKNETMVIQECGIGLVKVKHSGDTLAFAAPPLVRTGPLSSEERAEALRLTGVDENSVVEAVHVANGPQWRLLRLRTAQDVLAAHPEPRAPAGTDIGLAGPSSEGSASDWELRAFFVNHQGNFVEDPVTGSFNAGVAVHLFESGLVETSCVVTQGRRTGADGLIKWVRDEHGQIWIGGRCDTIAGGASLRRNAAGI